MLLFRETFLKFLITYNFQQFRYKPVISHVILHNFVQLYVIARRDLVPKILLNFITVRFMYSSCSAWLWLSIAETCSLFALTVLFRM